LEAEKVIAGESRDVAWLENSLRLIHKSRLFLTEKGRIGLALQGKLIEVGDECCIIFGSTVPFLLTPAREGRHKLVSDCYIHGVMDGELLEQFDESDLSSKQIILE
jgi:hypothetical protein